MGIEDIASYLYGAAENAGLTVVAETNVTPAITLYDARDTSPSLLSTLGISTYVVVRTADGKVVTEYGTRENKNYILAAVLLTLGFTAITLAGGSIVKLIKSI